MTIHLWMAAILFYGIGDGILTYTGVKFYGIEEGRTGTRWILGPRPSLSGLMGLKFGSLSLFYIVFMLLSANPYRDWIPIGVAILGILAVINNTYVIVGERWRSGL